MSMVKNEKLQVVAKRGNFSLPEPQLQVLGTKAEKAAQ